jgi:hypothetical protein
VLCLQALSSSKTTLARLDLSGNDLTPDVMGHVAKAIAEYVHSFNFNLHEQQLHPTCQPSITVHLSFRPIKCSPDESNPSLSVL